MVSQDSFQWCRHMAQQRRRVASAADRIGIIPVSLLEDQRPCVEEICWIRAKLDPPMGWHYLLDLPWAARELQPWRGMHVLDAGAGTGVMQWWLAEHGVNVLSVDRIDRSRLGYRFRAWCPVRGFGESDLRPMGLPGWKAFLPPRRLRSWHRWPLRLENAFRQLVSEGPRPPSGRGTVTIWDHDLANMREIPDDSVDAIVSISALEHNDPDRLRMIVKELMRVLRPRGRLIATLAAARDHDWFHEPSGGWCYTDTTLRNALDIPAGCPSNYDCYDRLFERLRNCEELRAGLPDSYFASGRNGMPWGIWDPKYQPVGVVKTKTQRT